MSSFDFIDAFWRLNTKTNFSGVFMRDYAIYRLDSTALQPGFVREQLQAIQENAHLQPGWIRRLKR